MLRTAAAAGLSPPVSSKGLVPGQPRPHRCRPWRRAAPIEDLHEPADPGPLGGISHQHRASPVDGVLARGTAAAPAPTVNTTASAPDSSAATSSARPPQVTDHSFG